MSNLPDSMTGYIDRFVKLREEAADIRELEKDLEKEAKNAGLKPTMIKKAVAEKMKRDKDPKAYDDRHAELQSYLQAAGLL